MNTGGVLLIRDDSLARRANDLLILTEGFITYGGLSGRDLEAMAQGFIEVLDEDYLQYRIRSIAYLGEHLLEAGVPIIEPPGGHAIYIDAAAVSPHIPREQFPGQALLVALYRHAGIRAVEIGSVMFGARRPGICAGSHPPLELVRLAIPRRVYTQSHIDYVVEAVVEVYQKRETLRGLRIVDAPPTLRHFTANLKSSLTGIWLVQSRSWIQTAGKSFDRRAISRRDLVAQHMPAAGHNFSAKSPDTVDCRRRAAKIQPSRTASPNRSARAS